MQRQDQAEVMEFLDEAAVPPSEVAASVNAVQACSMIFRKVCADSGEIGVFTRMSRILPV